MEIQDVIKKYEQKISDNKDKFSTGSTHYKGIKIYEKDLPEIFSEFVSDLKQLNDSSVKRSELIIFLDSLREYERESHNLIGLDERESSEFVDIYLSKKD